MQAASLSAETETTNVTETKKLNEWCTATYPKEVKTGQTIEVKVEYHGLDSTKLGCDLHWCNTEGKWVGGMSGGGRARDVKGDGEETFHLGVISKDDLGYVRCMIFLTPTGQWQDMTKRADSPKIPVKGAATGKAKENGSDKSKSEAVPSEKSKSPTEAKKSNE